MKAAIYNPYLDTLGGGEKYTLSFAKVLLELDWDVNLAWNDTNVLGKLEKRFDLDLKGLRVVKDIKRGDGYDLCFWVSDGSIPLLRSRKNILHFQVPFTDVGGASLLNKMKFYRINEVVCNSHFTKKFIDEEYAIDSKVIYPPVDVLKFTPTRKRNSILYVGRFSNLTQSKGQEILVKNFKKLVDHGLKNYNLVLAGGVEVGEDGLLSKLKNMSKGYPIEIVKSPNHKELVSFYSRSKFFWSAAGFGYNEQKFPQKVEHFGITTVEAMASGCVPLVFSAGGQKEIVKNEVDGYLWTTEKELRKKTNELIEDRQLYLKVSEKAVIASQKFSYEEFKNQVTKLL